MKTFWLFLCLTTTSLPLMAQVQLDGLWRGKLMLKEAKGWTEYPFELYLTRQGKSVHGRSYILLPTGQKVQMDLQGRYYDDLSIYLEEVDFIETGNGDPPPPYFRKFQLVWRRGLYESALKGHWQEIKDEVTDEGRRRGQLSLEKVVNKNA
jgi:hypothetical protein